MYMRIVMRDFEGQTFVSDGGRIELKDSREKWISLAMDGTMRCCVAA